MPLTSRSPHRYRVRDAQTWGILAARDSLDQAERFALFNARPDMPLEIVGRWGKPLRRVTAVTEVTRTV